MYSSGVTIVLLLLLPYEVLAIALREPLVDTDVIIGNTVTLSGTVTDNTGKLPISWRRQETQEVLTLGEFVFSTQLYVRRRYDIEVFSETYNLIISNVELGDEGAFEIGYISNNKFVPLASTTLTVVIPPDAGFPVCDASPTNAEYLVGQSLTLRCQSKGGKPTPDIVWRRNGVEVARTSTSDVLNHVITLEQFDNGALFECQLDGSSVTETLSCQERPNVATPTVNLGPSVVMIDEGSDAVFNCDGQGVLSPTYDWSFPTNILQSDRYLIENAERRLTIRKTTIADNNVVVRCEMKSSRKVVAGRSATLLIRPKPTTQQPTTVAPTTMTETIAPTTSKPTTILPTTTVPLQVAVTAKEQPLTSVDITTTGPTTKLLPDTTQNTPIRQTTPLDIATTLSKKFTRPKTESPTFTTGYMTIPQDNFITTPPLAESKGTLETTIVPVEETNSIPKQKSDDNGKTNNQHLGLIFATATAMIIVLTIVVFSAFCLVVCKAREKKDSFNVSNNASSLAGSTGPPYNNGIYRTPSEYHDDYELTDTISQRESQASATESAAAVSVTPSPECLYTMPAKLGKTSKIYHPSSSSQPDFSTFRLVDESLRKNKALSSNALGKQPRPVTAPKPPRSYGEYENLNPNYTTDTVRTEKQNAADIKVVDVYENTPLQISAIYENRSDIRNAALLETTSPVAPYQSIPFEKSIEDTYEDVLKIADSFLRDLEQLS